MSKYARNPVPKVPTPDTITAQGGEGFVRDDKHALFVLAVANLGGDTFYESEADRDRRMVELVHRNTKADPEWTAAFIGWLRQGAFIRSASIVAAAEYVKAGGPNGRAVVASVLQRADEPAEMLGYWLNTHGRNIPKPVKRGIADAVRRLYTEWNAIKYDGTNADIRFGDVIALTHPSPTDAWPQGDLFRYLIDRRHGRTDFNVERLPKIALDRDLMATPPDQRRARLDEAIAAGWQWERLGSWLGKWDSEAWSKVIPNMGAMALVRNLRNFDEVGISDDAAALVIAKLSDPVEIAKSRQLPFRFLTAWKNINSMRWGQALETALGHSVHNIPSFPGRTLILVDVSGSMGNTIASKRTDGWANRSQQILRWEGAALFGAAIARSGNDAKLVMFDTAPRGELRLTKAESILRTIEAMRPFVTGGGTDTLGCLAQAYNGEDRVIIITDEQTGSHYNYGGYYGRRGSGWDAVKHIRVPVYTFNAAGYQAGHAPDGFGNWHTFGGLSDQSFKAIDAIEQANRRIDVWPWEVPDPGVTDLPLGETEAASV